MRVELLVTGMTCAACAARVEGRLNAIENVSATVNIATEKATVTAPPSVPVRLLIEEIERAGYAAEVAGASDGPAEAKGGMADATRVAYLRRRLTVALVFFVPLSDLSVLLSLFPAYRFPGWQWVLIALAIPVAGWAAWPFHRAALKNARHGSSSMDTLVSLGIVAACGWSVYAMFVLDNGTVHESAWHELIHASGGGIYLEVAASVTTFLLAGRWYEARARRNAGDAMRELAGAGAKDACVLADDGTEQRVPVAALCPGDRFVVRPGETIAADGAVLFGQSAVDRSMMTGESVPVDVAEGDAVTAGTVAVSGRLIVRAAKVGRDTQLAHLVALVEEAQTEKAAIQRLEQASEHAVAAALSAAACGELGPLPHADGFTALPGLGARGVVDGHDVIVGREKVFTGGGLDISAELAARCVAWERAGRTAVLAGWDGQARGAIAVADTVKPSAAGAVRALRALGLRTILLTGDNQATADAVAAEAGIGEVIAEAMPDGKVAVIADLQAQGRLVAMVGDGVNDGPALAAADLGLAMGSGTDVAICAADMILLRDDLNAVPEAIKLARATLATIRRNLAWAFGYNIAAIPLAAAGFLNPLIAGAAMAASSVFVVANSVRLRQFGMPATGVGPWRRPATFEPERPSENGTGTRPGDGSGTKEHTASCLE